MVGRFFNVLPVGNTTSSTTILARILRSVDPRTHYRYIPGTHYYEYNIVVGVGVDCQVRVWPRDRALVLTVVYWYKISVAKLKERRCTTVRNDTIYVPRSTMHRSINDYDTLSQSLAREQHVPAQCAAPCWFSSTRFVP